tara:strand:- start:368 stop:490 length:123 start_codon:yes stop_codon:yes gene_type:complete
MDNQKTQQFSKFYIKNIKVKLQKDNDNKKIVDEFLVASSG